MVKNAKQYILVALAAILAVTVVVTIVSITLRPAHIDFSISRAEKIYPNNKRVEVMLNLTLSANNTSRRAAAMYRTMYVDVCNNTGECFRARVITEMPLFHQRRPRRGVAVEAIDAVVELEGGYTASLGFQPSPQDFIGNTTSYFTVMVTAVAQFKVGTVWTRRYVIKMSCAPVIFLPSIGLMSNSTMAPVDCI